MERNALLARALPLQDPARLGALLARLQPRLLGLARSFTRDATAAEDVVQNAFEKALRHGARFRGGARVSTWLYRIVANESLMWLRSERRRLARLVDQDPQDWSRTPDPDPGALTLLSERERCAKLLAGLDRLRPGERELLLRSATADKSYQELGAETGLHPGAVKSRVFRARRRLAEVVGEM